MQSDLFSNLFIFEMANNHQGSVEHGLKIIREMGRIARRHSIRAGMKFQYRELDSIIHPDYRARKDVKHIPRFVSTALSDKNLRRLVSAVREEGMLAIVTPFDEPSVARCIDHGIDILKVASCSATDWPLLEEMAATGRPMIVSTGGVLLYDIDSIVSFLTHKRIESALMHCVGLYPTPGPAMHLNFISKMVRRYPKVPIGWSGHEEPVNLDPIKIAIARGARLFERHVGIATTQIQLNAYSMDPQQTDAWVRAALTARQICGEDESKHTTQEELDSLRSLKRGVFARRAISKGHTITRDDVFFAMPCGEGQTTCGEFGRYRTVYVASRDYAPSQPIHEFCQPDDIARIREIVHDVKGMLFEAQIALGGDFQIELSHHHGIDQFRRTGAAIINVVNRNYCKKLIVVLPGQSHPAHQHKVKEETFQLLWGDLEVSIDENAMFLSAGDKMLIEPGHFHAFRSRGGAIFEEISSTHRRDDSFYHDSTIDKMDPMQRKTILESW